MIFFSGMHVFILNFFITLFNVSGYGVCVLLWRSKDSLSGGFLFYFYMGSRDQAQLAH